MRPTRPALALALGTALLVAGCSGSAEPAAQAPAAAPSTTAAGPTGGPTAASTTGGSTGSTTPTSAATAGSPTAGATGSTSTPTSGAPTDLASLGLQDRHPNGSLLQVTSVQVERTGVVVGVSVVNGHTDEIKLNTRGLYLQDDVGNGYNFREPAQNGDLAVAPGAELVGELVFLGVLDPSATELTLKTNVSDAEDTIDTTSRADWDTAPSMLVPGIPVG